MAQIDSSIYFKQQTPDIMGSVQRGLSMRDMLDKRKQKQGIQDAYAAGVVENKDGTKSFDSRKTLPELYKVSPQHGVELDTRMQKQNTLQDKAKREKMLNSLDLRARLLGSAKDQTTWESSLKTAQDLGMDMSKEPKAFDIGYRNNLLNQVLTAKDKMANQFKQQEIDIKREKLDILRAKAKKDAGSNAFLKTARSKEAGIYGETQSGLKKINGALNSIDIALRAQMDYSQKSLTGGTGPIVTGFGLSKYFSEDTENLNAKLKSVNLKNMTATFAGMAKAIDSDAERRAWNGTQADVSNDDKTNMEILLAQQSILMKDKAEIMAQRNEVRTQGHMDSYVSPVDGKVTSLISPSGEMMLFPKQNVERLLKQGYMSVEDYAEKSISFKGRSLKTEDNEALDWARQNPNDPRAKQIMQINGVGG